MASKKFLERVQRKFNDDFKSQNPELFDVAFDIGGKKLYAHKYRLSTISSTFESMLSDRWTSKDDVVPIKDYSFDDFKNFITFLYTGEYKFNNENIFTMLDMAEFYQIQELKELCDKYLSQMEYSLNNFFQVIEAASKYSLTEVQQFIVQNFSIFVKSDHFLNADKSFIQKIVAFDQIKPEELFQAIYEWAEVQVVKKQKESIDETFNMNDAMKTELTEFLPHIKFKKMRPSFLHGYVVKRGFLFTYDDLSDILLKQTNVRTVKVTNKHGQTIYGNLTNDDDAVGAIESLKNHESRGGFRCSYWETKCKVPSASIQLKKRDGVKWYLIYRLTPYVKLFAVITAECIYNSGYFDYLLAEMNSDTDFVCTDKCKIEIE
uniref:BTB domain-containing protein n=1 Tax=Panagrolaimus davidi TaxID=227884 RepID=A0A914QL55_9BILA